MLERLTELNLLLDFYNSLLTSKQKFALEMHYSEDLSLGEIAENLNISRQAVHDLIRRGEKLLKEYENKLGLVQKYLKRQKIVKEIKQLISNKNNEHICTLLNQIVD
ncbi:putative DNA-binding protein [Clostridium sp. 'deep sea']|uniref:putative DNA-binding protein n=1 Tax=Clostridium sp. 'deep sea' TaxID=2779445 RepID=UPI00189668D1|nr:putative DNA-binding protein [Clostridium sp. 'deep sea']QOR36073.1 putative DNA-binding protein [Clostridium sp. 'deep sea']